MDLLRSAVREYRAVKEEIREILHEDDEREAQDRTTGEEGEREVEDDEAFAEEDGVWKGGEVEVIEEEESTEVEDELEQGRDKDDEDAGGDGADAEVGQYEEEYGEEAEREEEGFEVEDGSMAERAVEQTRRPMTYNASLEELYRAAITMMKHLTAQVHNEHGDDPTLISHQHLDDALIDQHETDDWRVQIIRSEDANGDPFHLEAKMDTGADKNLISLEAAEGHDLMVYAIEGPEPAFTVGSGATTGVDGIVRLSYSAGHPSQQYTEEFYAMSGLPHDVILGMPFLMHSHAITVNPQFAHKQENEDFLLFETQPATGDSKAKNAAFKKQKREEREAAFQLRMAQQERGR